ncbi:MAG: thioredoxin family protein [Clostridium sp.]|nr:thioredoxin family protein [Clostridium sp.]
MEVLNSKESIIQFVNSAKLSLLYISSNNCSVCHALLPKMEEMLECYPEVQCKKIEIDKLPEIAGQLSIFTVPVVIFYVQGKEIFRRGRFISIEEVKQAIDRYYNLLV